MPEIWSFNGIRLPDTRLKDRFPASTVQIYRPIMKFVLLMWTEIKYWHANSIISIHDSSNGQNCHNNSFDSHIFLIKFKWTIVMKFGNLNSNFVQRIEFPYALTLGHRSTLMSVLNTFLHFE